MPFFLVTHTSLIEAYDEQVAAQTVVNRIRGGQKVTVIVKSDEDTAINITVEARNRSAKMRCSGREEGE